MGRLPGLPYKTNVMEEDVTGNVVQILLNGISVSQFIAFYIAGIVGAIISFGINIGQAVKKNVATPNTFQWNRLKVKSVRWMTTLLLLAVGIVFNKEILGAALDSASPIELTLWSALLVGMSTDQLGRKLSGIKK